MWSLSTADKKVIARKLAWERLADDMQFYSTNYPNGFPLIIASDVAYESSAHKQFHTQRCS